MALELELGIKLGIEYVFLSENIWQSQKLPQF